MSVLITDPETLLAMNDTDLIQWRANARAQLQRTQDASLARLYDTTTAMLANRARAAWSRGSGEGQEVSQ